MSTKSRIVIAFASLCALISASPADAHDGYGRPRGYDPYRPPVYAYQPPVVHRPPPVYYSAWPPFRAEHYWRRSHHHGERRW